MLEHDRAVMVINLNGAAIGVLEMIGTEAASRCIAVLGRDQQRVLKIIDATAAKLGAPYKAWAPK